MTRIFANRRQTFTKRRQHITLEQINNSLNRHRIYVIIVAGVYCLVLGGLCYIMFWDYF